MQLAWLLKGRLGSGMFSCKEITSHHSLGWMHLLPGCVFSCSGLDVNCLALLKPVCCVNACPHPLGPHRCSICSWWDGVRVHPLKNEVGFMWP